MSKPIDVAAIGQRIREARSAAGITMKQAAEAAGMSEPKLSRIERGATLTNGLQQPLTVQDLDRICYAIGADMAEVLGMTKKG